ncbi:MAG: universal stress protein [Deltaproteobacteria bacterium]|nr:universal stress protein [Deltaproteobacteria bacterium]
MAHIQKILVPVDGSPASIAALEQAVTLADDLSATVDVLHIRKRGAAETDRDMDDAVAAARSRLGGRFAMRTESGDPVGKILEVADAQRPDLIVMGTHGRVGRLRALVGSVAESVVRNAPCPVLTVRRSVGDEESFSERIHHRTGVARPSY